MASHPLPGRNLVRNLKTEKAVEPQNEPARAQTPVQKPKGPPRGKKPAGRGKGPCPPRLPDHSVFRIEWSVMEQQWKGYLEVPNEGVFTSSAFTAYTLLSKLDNLYRQSLKKSLEQLAKDRGIG